MGYPWGILKEFDLEMGAERTSRNRATMLSSLEYNSALSHSRLKNKNNVESGFDFEMLESDSKMLLLPDPVQPTFR